MNPVSVSVWTMMVSSYTKRRVNITIMVDGIKYSTKFKTAKVILVDNVKICSIYCTKTLLGQ